MLNSQLSQKSSIQNVNTFKNKDSFMQILRFATDAVYSKVGSTFLMTFAENCL